MISKYNHFLKSEVNKVSFLNKIVGEDGNELFKKYVYELIPHLKKKDDMEFNTMISEAAKINQEMEVMLKEAIENG